MSPVAIFNAEIRIVVFEYLTKVCFFFYFVFTLLGIMDKSLTDVQMTCKHQQLLLKKEKKSFMWSLLIYLFVILFLCFKVCSSFTVITCRLCV